MLAWLMKPSNRISVYQSRATISSTCSATGIHNRTLTTLRHSFLSRALRATLRASCLARSTGVVWIATVTRRRGTPSGSAPPWGIWASPHPAGTSRPSTSPGRARWPRRCEPRRARPRDLLDDGASRHHQHPVTQPRQLDGVARLDEQGGAGGGPGTQGRVDVDAGADVDTLGGLVGEDHRRLGEERSGDGHLLLVASREELDWLVERRGADLELLDELLHRFSLGPPAQQTEPAEAPQRLDGGVHPHAQDAHQRLVFPVAGKQHDPGAHRLPGRDQGQLVSGADDPAGAWRDPAGQGVEELRLAVAFGAGDPDDLAAVQREADRAERLPLQGIDDEYFLGLGRRRNRRWERRLERPADDPLDELRLPWWSRRRTCLDAARHGAP